MRFFTYFYEDELMRYFYKRPEEFNKYSGRELLSYGLGATLYMPADRPDFHQEILSKKLSGLTSVVIDLEDAVGDSRVFGAESLLIDELQKLFRALNEGFISIEDLPLMFVRVRNLKQLQTVKERLEDAVHLLTGVVLPKFSSENGAELLHEVLKIHTNEHPFYAMPILETDRVLHKETRMEELVRIKQIVDRYKEIVLNIRIGATDFCGLYGIRRSPDTTVYDIAILRDCISDIINIFGRIDSPYVVSGPVWEYFSAKNRMLKPQLRQTPFRERFGDEGLHWRRRLIEENLDGLMRETLMDIANGISGKTVIHPSHIKIVQSLNVVPYEEYVDASNIIKAATGEIGVMKSDFANKMNEIKPHLYWAEKIMLKSRLYGVLHEEFTNIDLIKKEVYISHS
ncbi:HpcH/HpaI aldolase/citrate lyase family protein [Neobacillus citreus]|uniref:HpcH/HpaI aldolase/citrate lyase family protein n=1 Tax=Neobacillus citreus TaxID=2833578 RepID=A0A942T4U0_9BACI|nr:HpcH/HpaI aldolase/citrate lyase family protein [Neobacillus citreus]MCH6269222.1 HpcH/HpaI aldolase/citrate lyase family protein [Neobacillus citreus]